MDAVDPIPGYSLAIPGPPFSPWLRLAHLWTLPPTQRPGHGDRLRRLLDFEFFLQLEGDTWLAFADGRHVPLPAGHCALIPPGLEHAWSHRPGCHLAVHADLHAQPAIEPMAMLDWRALLVERGPALKDWRWTLQLGGVAIDLPLVRKVDLARWRRRFEPLVAQYGARAHGTPAARLVAAGILGEAFAEWLAVGATHQDRLLALLAEAASGPLGGAGVPQLARRCGMGETAFRAAVRRATGRGPRDHLERLRLERAAYALRATGAPVARIAAEAGYADPFHFSRAFRRVYGRSPRAWRDG